MGKPTQDEMDEVLDRCSEAVAVGSRYPGMLYEDGIRDAIDWMNNEGEKPLED